MIALRAFASFRRRQLSEELQSLQSSRAPISSANLKVVNPKAIGRSIGELRVRETVGVVVSRLRRGEEVLVPTKYTVLMQGDTVTVVGTETSLVGAVELFGERAAEQLQTRRDSIDMRRILVSRREHAGQLLSELDLERQFNAQVTRLRRADIDLLPSPDIRLELGDRLRVVAPVDQLKELSAFSGDSERELAELDGIALALGLCGGLLLARLPLPVWGAQLQLGTAGGTLLVALLLGRLGRTGPFVWSIPFEANHALRDFGLLLFLASVGVSAGGNLAGVLSRQGLAMLGLGMLVTLLTLGLVFVLAPSLGQGSVAASMGAASGMQTQPAALAAGFELSSRSEETHVAYALVYPVAMIGKILLAQLIVLFA